MNAPKLEAKHIPCGLLKKLETFFGASLSGVKIYESNLPDLFNAVAFTYGETIFFKPSRFDTSGVEGLSLLGHELTHVLQQRFGIVQSKKWAFSCFDTELETQADNFGNAAAAFLHCDNLKPFRPIFCSYSVTTQPIKLLQFKICDFATIEDIKFALSLRDDINAYSIESASIERLVTAMHQNEHEQYTLDQVIDQIKKTLNRATGAIARRFRTNRATKHTYNIDLIENSPLSEAKRNDIAAVARGCFLTEICGLQTARVMTLQDWTGSNLRTRNPYNANYIRSQGDWVDVKEVLKKDKKIYKSYEQHFQEATKDLGKVMQHFFVNSQVVIDQLKGLPVSKGKFYHKKMAEGLYYFASSVRMRDFFSKEIPMYCILGGTVSTYQLLKLLKPYRPLPQYPVDKSVDVIEYLKKFLTISPTYYQQEPLKQMNFGLLLLSLRTVVRERVKTSVMQHDPVLCKLLSYLYNIVTSLSVNGGHTGFSKTADLTEQFFGEALSVLSIINPYNLKDFENAVLDIYRRRAPVLASDKFDLHVSLQSSGMGALSTCMFASSEKFNSEHQLLDLNGPMYFEFDSLIKKRFVNTSSSQNIIFLATLQRSDGDLERRDVKAIYQPVIDKLTYYKIRGILVIDNTIEWDEGENGDLNQIFKALSSLIEKGRLSILLAKSYQKYVSCGAARLMSGVAMLVTTNNENVTYFRQFKADDEFIQFPEKQLLIHLLKNAPDAELKAINRAINNLNKVRSSFHGVITQLPFYFTKKTAETSEFNLFRAGIRERDSFGFFSACFSNFDTLWRINPGQEPLERLYEMLTYIMLTDSESKNRKQITATTVEGIYNEVKQKFSADAKLEKQYIENAAVSVFYYHGESLETKDISFIENVLKIQEISREIRAYISSLWLKLKFKSGSLDSALKDLKSACERRNTEKANVLNALTELKEKIAVYKSIQQLIAAQVKFQNEPYFPTFVNALRHCETEDEQIWADLCEAALWYAWANERMDPVVNLYMKRFAVEFDNVFNNGNISNCMYSLVSSYAIPYFLEADIFDGVCLCSDESPTINYLLNSIFSGMANSVVRYICEQAIKAGKLFKADYLIRRLESNLYPCKIPKNSVARIQHSFLKINGQCGGIQDIIQDSAERIYSTTTALIEHFCGKLKAARHNVYELITDNDEITINYKQIILQEIIYDKSLYYFSKKVISQLDDMQLITAPPVICRKFHGLSFDDKEELLKMLEDENVSEKDQKCILAVASVKKIVDKGLLAEDIATTTYLSALDNFNTELEWLNEALQDIKNGTKVFGEAGTTADVELQFDLFQCENAKIFYNHL